MKLFFLLITLLCTKLIASAACDVYQLRRILESGGSIEINNACSAYDARSLAEIGKERVNVKLKGFSAYDARQIAEKGARLEASARDFSSYDMRQIAELAKHKLLVDVVGYGAYDARQVVNVGPSFSLDSSFSSYDARQICKSLISPALGYAYTKGFAEYDLRQISEAGCALIKNGEDSEISYYEARRILESGGSLEINNQFSAYETRQLAEIGKQRLTVRLPGFSAYDARQIVEKGANFFVDNTFSTYDARQICRSKVAPAVGKVYATGFSDYDLKEIAREGCQIIY